MISTGTLTIDVTSADGYVEPNLGGKELPIDLEYEHGALLLSATAEEPTDSTTVQDVIPLREPAKKALLIGVHYTDLSEREDLAGLQLNAPHSDTDKIRELLIEHFQYRYEDITVLRDDEKCLDPTRDNIIKAMKDLVHDARPRDRLVFHFAGHGSQIAAQYDQNEVDGQDEVIWPSDIHNVDANEFTAEGYIVDDDLKRILVDNLPVGCQLTAILDFCNSGTGLDLPSSISGEQLPWSPVNVGPSYNFEELLKAKSRGGGRRRGTLRMPFRARGHSTGQSHGVEVLPENKSVINVAQEDKPHVISWSSSMDGEQGWEGENGSWFIKGLIDTLDKYPGRTFTNREMLNELSRRLYNRANHIKKIYRKRHLTLDMPTYPKPQFGSLTDVQQVLEEPFSL